MRMTSSVHSFNKQVFSKYLHGPGPELSIANATETQFLSVSTALKVQPGKMHSMKFY